MSIIMVGSLMTGWILQYAQQRDLNRQQQQALEPTPIPTFEPPVTTDTITLVSEALQANGIFTIGVPEPPEWEAVESSYDAFASRARLLLRNDRNVIEATAEQPETPFANTDELSAFYDPQRLGTSWRSYSNWRETQRSVVTGETGREYLQIDFELEFQGRTFVARQRAWADDGTVYSVRVVTPENATDLLVFLLENVSDSFDVIDALNDVPLAWNAYYDPVLEHIIRYPQAWQVTDAAEGAPASIEAENVALRVEAHTGESLTDEAAAESYVAALPNVTEVLSVEAITRDTLDGYTVTYHTRTLDGETGSGLVVLLNSEDALHVADLRVGAVETDLTASSDDNPDLAQYQQVMSTFYPFAGVQYAAPSAASGAPLTDNTAQQPGPVNLGF